MLLGSMITFNEPTDGWDTIEKLLLKEIVLKIYRDIIFCPVENFDSHNVTALEQYKKANNNLVNAFILMAINESGYTQKDVSAILNISQVAVQKRLKKTIHKVKKKNRHI